MQTRKILIKVCAWVALIAFVGLTILSAAMSSVYAAKSSSQIKKEMDVAKKKKARRRHSTRRWTRKSQKFPKKFTRLKWILTQTR